jgi:hypothetical protein
MIRESLIEISAFAPNLAPIFKSISEGPQGFLRRADNAALSRTRLIQGSEDFWKLGEYQDAGRGINRSCLDVVPPML